MPRFTDEELKKILDDNPDLRAAQGRTAAVQVTTPAPAGPVDRVVATNEPEKDFQKWLIGELNRTGWTVCEFRKARIRKGGVDVYRTPFGAQGNGFPDLVAVRPPRVLIIENKSDAGAASPEQINWLMLFARCPGVESKCWSPKDRTEILETIT